MGGKERRERGSVMRNGEVKVAVLEEKREGRGERCYERGRGKSCWDGGEEG